MKRKSNGSIIGSIFSIAVLLFVLSWLYDLIRAHWIFILIAVLVVVVPIVAFKVYELLYYRSSSFLNVKQRIDAYIQDCNDLNQHIESLKNTALVSHKTDYGDSSYNDDSKWNYQKKYENKHKYEPNVCDCSRSACDKAQKKPFLYVCKYFGITETEETLEEFEEILNNFYAVEEGKTSIQAEKAKILDSIQNDIPLIIRKLSKKKLARKLGFEEIDMSTAYFPKYVFRYVSPGGNSSNRCDVVMDIDNLSRFVVYLSERIEFRKSAAGQRALMTSKLRQKIKERDGFACKKCGASVEKEPNLLLEIDHIIPVSKGGLTTEDNLQTLCWRCNRSKGAKI